LSDEPFLGSHETHEELEDLEGLDEVNFSVRISDVSRTFLLGKREIHALKNINLEVQPGDLIIISGESGSGKTTLLNMIGCIDYATDGRVLIMDVPIGDYDESFRSDFRLGNTGFIFQSYNLISTLTAIENVMFPMQLTDKTKSDLRKRAEELLDLVKLSERLDHLPWQLSSGEQQRVAIARAMANDPPIILADEPTANLDSVSAQMVRDLLLGLNTRGKTVIAMTHDEKLINNSNARRFIMVNGELHEVE
jgi:putative ABC transport system ATP-binding protein